MRVRIIVCAALLVAGGCGRGGYQLAPVSGQVTMDNKPLPSVYVNFQPQADKDNPNPGPGSYAVTDANGRYTLRVDAKQSGAVVGRHRVTIALQFAEDLKGGEDTGSPDGTPKLPRLGSVPQIPKRYNEKSELSFDVPPGGTDKADFPLKSK